MFIYSPITFFHLFQHAITGNVSQSLLNIGTTTGNITDNSSSFHGIYNLADNFNNEMLIEIMYRMYYEA